MDDESLDELDQQIAAEMDAIDFAADAREQLDSIFDDVYDPSHHLRVCAGSSAYAFWDKPGKRED